MDFKNSKLGQWLNNVKKDIPSLAGDVMQIITSPNPVGAGVGLLLEKIKGASPDISEPLLTEFEMNRLQIEKEMAELELENMKSAREMYAQKSEMADLVAKSVMKWNLPLVLILVIVNVACIKFLDQVALALVSNVIGFVLNQLLNERTQIIGFFFGSSLGSKMKQIFSKKE